MVFKFCPVLKKILLAGCLLLLQAIPAQALPGKTLAETESWVKHHPFLSTWTLANDPSLNNYDLFRIAFRELQDHWFIDIFMEFKPASRGQTVQQSTVMFDFLHLLQKEYVGKKNSEEETYGDKRPWKDVACKDIWTRDNQTAFLLLSKIYSPAVAEDFKTSKQAYKGPFYTLATVGWGEDGFKWFPEKADETQLDHWGMGKLVQSDVSLYIGSLYSYEVRNDAPVESDIDLGVENSCIGLKINPRQWGIETAGTLQHNLKMYAKWQQMEQAKNQRNKPAEIKVQ